LAKDTPLGAVSTTGAKPTLPTPGAVSVLPAKEETFAGARPDSEKVLGGFPKTLAANHIREFNEAALVGQLPHTGVLT
jgi:hypothetical protein